LGEDGAAIAESVPLISVEFLLFLDWNVHRVPFLVRSAYEAEVPYEDRAAFLAEARAQHTRPGARELLRAGWKRHVALERAAPSRYVRARPKQRRQPAATETAAVAVVVVAGTSAAAVAVAGTPAAAVGVVAEAGTPAGAVAQAGTSPVAAAVAEAGTPAGAVAQAGTSAAAAAVAEDVTPATATALAGVGGGAVAEPEPEAGAPAAAGDSDAAITGGPPS
jgi:hypothetical protein